MRIACKSDLNVGDKEAFPAGINEIAALLYNCIVSRRGKKTKERSEKRNGILLDQDEASLVIRERLKEIERERKILMSLLRGYRESRREERIDTFPSNSSVRSPY